LCFQAQISTDTGLKPVVHTGVARDKREERDSRDGRGAVEMIND